MSKLERRFCRLCIALAALCYPAAAQVFDNTGNKLLNGTYYFREISFNLNQGLAAVIYGTIAFNGSGSYTISATEGDTSSGSLQSYNVNGSYSISASGFGYIQNQLLNSPTYGTVANGVFIGSGSESGYNDLFIAAPLSSQNAGTFQGSYTMAYIDPTGALTNGTPYDAQVQLTSNGSGGIGTVNVSAYSSNSTPTTQSISGVKYTTSSNAFVLAFPTNSSNNLIQGSEYLYSTPDGSFVFGGSPTNFDMIVGVKGGSSGNNFGGLYYQAGLDEDVSQLASTGGVGLDTYYGSFNASNGNIIGHQRIQDGIDPTYGDTYYDAYPQGTNGTYNNSVYLQNYTGGNGGTVRIGYGLGPSLGISVALQAPAFSGSGVYINPTGVVNAGSYAPFTAGVSPGELVTITGTGIGPGRLQVASTLPFPTTLGGVQVMVNNIAAPIYYVSAGQVAAIVPYEINGATVAQFQIINNGTSSNAVTEFVNATTPGVFTIPPDGIHYAAALHANYSLVSASSPAQIGETIQVYLTGLGGVFPTIQDGAAGPSSTLSTTSNTITADVSGTAATVTYSGLAPGLAGLYQVNVTIPSGVTAGDNSLDIIGPDSYTSESLIPVGGAGAARPAAHAVRPQHRRNAPKLLPLPHVFLQ